MSQNSRERILARIRSAVASASHPAGSPSGTTHVRAPRSSSRRAISAASPASSVRCTRAR